MQLNTKTQRQFRGEKYQNKENGRSLRKIISIEENRYDALKKELQKNSDAAVGSRIPFSNRQAYAKKH